MRCKHGIIKPKMSTQPILILLLSLFFVSQIKPKMSTQPIFLLLLSLFFGFRTFCESFLPSISQCGKWNYLFASLPPLTQTLTGFCHIIPTGKKTNASRGWDFLMSFRKFHMVICVSFQNQKQILDDFKIQALIRPYYF